MARLPWLTRTRLCPQEIVLIANIYGYFRDIFLLYDGMYVVCTH